MKKITVLLFCIFISVLSADLNLQWEHFYGAGNNDCSNNSILTDDGGILSIGYTESYGNGIWGKPDMWLVKMDNSGTIEWDYTYGVADSLDKAYDIIDTTDGYMIVGERMQDVVYGNGWGAIVMKVDYEGTELWSHKIGGDDNDMLRHIEASPDGGYIACGVTRSYGAQFIDGWIVKLDDDGAVEWQQHYGGSGYEVFKNIYPLPDGGYLAGGFSNSDSAGSYDFWFVQIDADGEVVSEFLIGDEESNRMHNFIPTSDGNFVLTGETANSSGSMRLFLNKMTLTGEILWEQTYQREGEGKGNQITELSDGGFGIAAEDYNAIGGPAQTDGWVVITDSEGNFVEDYFLHDAASDHFSSLHELSPGTYFAAGGNIFTNSMTELWIAKLQSTNVPMGTLSGSITDSDSNQPLSNVTVAVNTINTTSDTFGDYNLAIPVGDYEVTFEKEGYTSQNANISITENNATELDISLVAIEYAYNAPTNLVLSHEYVENNVYTLTWDAPELNEAPTFISYKLYVNNDYYVNIEPSELDIVISNELPVMADGLVHFYLTAVYSNPTGESEPSNEQTAAPYLSNDNNLEVLVKNSVSNFPNPFNPSTEIRFFLNKGSDVTLTIYNCRGQRVKDYVQKRYPNGYSSIEWNGKDNSDKNVSSGVYWYKLSTDNNSTMHKMLLVK